MIPVLLLLPEVACRPLELALGDVSELLEATVSSFLAVSELFSKAHFPSCFSRDLFTC